MQFESYNNDVKVNINALEKYFNKNTIKTEMNYDYDKPIPIKYITYYFNIPISFEILLDENKISLDKPLNAIVIRKEKLHKYNKYRTFIYFEDKHGVWYDADIHTNMSEDKIFFIFDSDDLKQAYSLDSEQNAYIQLIEDLNIYNSKEENKEILKKWLKEYGNYLEKGWILQF